MLIAAIILVLYLIHRSRRTVTDAETAPKHMGDIPALGYDTIRSKFSSVVGGSDDISNFDNA